MDGIKEERGVTNDTDLNTEDLKKMCVLFKKKVKEEGILLEVRAREFYEKPSEIKARTNKQAARRNKAKQDADDW